MNTPSLCGEGTVRCGCTACEEYWQWVAYKPELPGRIEPTIGDLDKVVIEEDKFDRIKF